jgi:hypothetical protein
MLDQGLVEALAQDDAIAPQTDLLFAISSPDYSPAFPVRRGTGMPAVARKPASCLAATSLMNNPG